MQVDVFRIDPAPPPGTLPLHFCVEVRLNHWYRYAADWHTEPVIKAIYKIISPDDARRTEMPLHPTNLH